MTPFLRPLLPLYLVFQLVTGSHAQSPDDLFLDSLLTAYQLPAVSLAVVRGEAVSYSAAIGLRSTDSGEPVDEKTIFSAASLSKPVFALAVLQLVEAGKLDLDRPVHEYFAYPDVEHDPRHRKVTARMLLSHASGLPNWRNGQLTFRFEPGTDFGYSGEGYVWLMRVVEHISGKPIDDLVRERLFDPLGMAQTAYVWQDGSINYALPHNYLDEVEEKRKPEEGNSAHSLQTTANDYAQLLIALFEAKGLSPETIKELGTPQIDLRSFRGGEPVTDTADLFSWGLGWGIQDFNGKRALWQWGDNGPFKGWVIAYPEEKKGLVFFVNHHNGLRLVPGLMDHFLGESCPAFDWLDYPMEDPPAIRLGKGVLRNGIEAAVGPFLAPGGEQLDTSLLDGEDLREVAGELWGRGKLEETDRLLQLATNTYPQDARLRREAAFFYLAQVQLETAQAHYLLARDLDPDLFPVENLLLPWQNRSEEANVQLLLEGHEDARRVMLAGAFNDWDRKALPLLRTKAGWKVALKLPAGTYPYKFVVDGEWILDPANEKTVEDGGSTNSLLEVE